jgi:hypothetical protein
MLRLIHECQGVRTERNAVYFAHKRQTIELPDKPHDLTNAQDFGNKQQKQ